MDFIWILVPLSPFLLVAALVLVPVYLRSKERQRLQETLRLAIEKGQPLPSEAIEALTVNVKAPPPPAPQRDLRTGIVWLSVGLATAVFALIIAYYVDPDAGMPLLAIAAFPAFIGAAFIVLWLLNRSKS